MKLTAKVKIQNGYLHEAVEKMGSVKALAEHLGVGYGTLSGWLNMRLYPYSLRREQEEFRERWLEIERKLVVLTGAFLDDIFPVELTEAAFIGRPKSFTVTQEVGFGQLTSGEQLRLSTSLDEVDERLNNESIHNLLETALEGLPQRRADVLRYRFGLTDGIEHTLEECAEMMSVTRERVRQIEVDALRKLRHPSLSKPLRVAYEGC